MGRVLASFKAGAQSQNRRGQFSSPSIANSLPKSRMTAYMRREGVHQIPHLRSASRSGAAKERELRQQLWEKDVEISELRACREQEAWQGKDRIQSMLDDQATMREALEQKDRDMLELSNRFQSRLDEDDQGIEPMRGKYNKLLRVLESHQENSRLLQRNADAEVKVLQEKLATVEQELETCKDDLFRIQPVCPTSDTSVIRSFESLSEQLVDWIDSQASAFETAKPDKHVGYPLSKIQDWDVASFLVKHPTSGEHVCRHMVNRYLIEHLFCPNIYSFGLSIEYAHMLFNIEQGMAALRPPIDPQMIKVWRAETLNALAATQEYKDIRKEQTVQATVNLFESLSTVFPKLFERRGEVMQSFHNQITTPATTIASTLQGLATWYRSDVASIDLLNHRILSREDLKKVIAIDMETGKTLKPGSRSVAGGEEVIGEFILALEPSLDRVIEGRSVIELRKETWLVRLDDNLGSQAHRNISKIDTSDCLLKQAVEYEHENHHT